MLTDLNQLQDAQTRSADGKLRPQTDGVEWCSNGGSHQVGNDGQEYHDGGRVAGKFGETGHETRDQHHSCGRGDLGQRLDVAPDPLGQPRLLPNATRWRSGFKDQMTT